MYSVKKRHKDTEKSQRDENITENYKTLKREFWKICSLIWYTYFIVAVRVKVFADMSKETLPKRRIWVNIESLVYLTLEYLSLESLVYLPLELAISFINCAQEGASLISKQRAVKKKMRICVNIKATRTKWIQSILKTMFEFMLTQVT